MDPRKILGVEPTATPQEIQTAYREKVRKHHPDMGGDAWAFQQVQQAYEALAGPAEPQPSASQTPKATRPKNNSSDPNAQPKQNAPKSSDARQGASRNDKKSDDKKAKKNRRRPPTNHRVNNRTVNDLRPHHWYDFLFGPLPLQTETKYFILVNCLDIFMTHLLLRYGAYESNPVAIYFIQRWGFTGAVVLKLAVVTIVCVIAQIVAMMRTKAAKFLLNAGTLIVGCVVVYSFYLYFKHFW